MTGRVKRYQYFWGECKSISLILLKLPVSWGFLTKDSSVLQLHGCAGQRDGCPDCHSARVRHLEWTQRKVNVGMLPGYQVTYHFERVRVSLEMFLSISDLLNMTKTWSITISKLNNIIFLHRILPFTFIKDSFMLPEDRCRKNEPDLTSIHCLKNTRELSIQILVCMHIRFCI